MVGNGRTAPTCQSGLPGRMGEWCTRRAHSMDVAMALDHGMSPWCIDTGHELVPRVAGACLQEALNGRTPHETEAPPCKPRSR